MITSARSRGRESSELRLWEREPWLLVLASLTAALDAVVALLQHVHFESGLDLSLADQAVWHYSRFEAPFSSILGKDILGDHFSPLVAVLTPLYWIWSDPRMLLLAQSALVAASIVPVFLFASSRLGRRGGYVVAVAYACCWPTQVGVAFDFHEVAFAPLLIALSILFADRRRWVSFWIAIVLLLGVKEDMALLVVFFGLMLLTRREWAHGIALVAVGVGWYELAVGVAIPHLSGGAGYEHWTYTQLGSNLPHALWALLKAPWKVFTIGFSPAEKVNTMLALLGPFLFLAVGSRLFILAIPLLAERFLSTDGLFWQTHFQYSMPVAPVIAMGSVDALARLRGRLPEHWRQRAVAIGTGAMAGVSLILSLFVISASALARIVDRDVFPAPTYAAGASQALAHVPDGVPLATVNYLLPHASRRDNIQLVGARTVLLVPYVLVNVTDLSCCGSPGIASNATLGTILDIGLSTTTPIYFDHGWLLAKHPPPGQHPTNGVLAPMPPGAARTVQRLQTRGAHAIAAVLGCGRHRPAFGPAMLSCLSLASARYAADEQALVAAIGSVEPILTGGCSAIARAAVTATDRLIADLRPLVAAARADNAAQLAIASRGEQNDNDNLALVAQAELFATLCSPR